MSVKIQVHIPEHATFAELRRIPLGMWQQMPTLESGHFDDLKYESPEYRVWVSRANRRDYTEGPEGDKAYLQERMTIERLRDGVWRALDVYGKEVPR